MLAFNALWSFAGCPKTLEIKATAHAQAPLLENKINAQQELVFC